MITFERKETMEQKSVMNGLLSKFAKQTYANSDCIVLVRSSGGIAPSYEKVGLTLAKTLQTSAFCFDDYISLHMATLIWRKNAVFVGPFTEPTLRRILPKNLFTRKSVFYCTTEGLPLLYWLKPLLKMMSKGALKIVTPSRFVAELLKNVVNVYAVIPHGLDLIKVKENLKKAKNIEPGWSSIILEAKASGKVIFLTVSSFRYLRKGLNYYFAALRELLKTEPNFLAVLKVPEIMKNFTMETELARHILFIEGTIPEVELYKLYSLSDVNVFPSLSEGFGLPIIEAFSTGKPVITLDAAPMNEINTPKTGWLIKTEKSYTGQMKQHWASAVKYNIPNMKDFTQKLAESITNHKERQIKASRALAKAKSYDCQKTYKRFKELFTD